MFCVYQAPCKFNDEVIHVVLMEIGNRLDKFAFARILGKESDLRMIVPKSSPSS